HRGPHLSRVGLRRQGEQRYLIHLYPLARAMVRRLVTLAPRAERLPPAAVEAMRECQQSCSSAPNGATRAKARLPTCSVRTSTTSSGSPAATAPATRCSRRTASGTRYT